MLKPESTPRVAAISPFGETAGKKNRSAMTNGGVVFLSRTNTFIAFPITFSLG
jgi:hypothetical protein